MLNKRIGLDGLNKYVMVGSPQVSPDSEKICFVVNKTNINEDCYESNLWMIDRKDMKAYQFTHGNTDVSPVWNKDGNRIAFVSRRTTKKQEKGGELWVIDVHGGEARLLLKMKGGIGNVRWSPDGRQILFLSNVYEKEEEGVRVITGLPVYRKYPASFFYNFRIHLFILDVESKKVKQITRGAIDVFTAEFSNNGKRIAYVSEKGEIRHQGMMFTDIFAIPTHGGRRRKITKSNLRVGKLAWSPDDKHIAFIGSNLARGLAPSHNHIYITSSTGRRTKNLTEGLNRSCTPEMQCDVTEEYSAGQGPIWQDNYIYFLKADGGETHVCRADYVRNEIKTLIEGKFGVGTFSVAKNVIAFSRTDPSEPTEIWMKQGEKIKKLTNFNSWVKEKRLSKLENCRFKASDGAEIEGWIMKPLDFKQNQKYPAILEIHGGPQGTYGYVYTHEFQMLAAKGYVVMFANPRGSEGYSEEFKDVRRQFGERDYKDLMEFVDHTISKHKYVDSERIGVAGPSYGGFMTNWIITHTDRFKAAVPQDIVSNWMSFFGSSDVGWFFLPESMGADFGADIWELEEKYLENSPLRHAKNVTTPTLIIHSLEDYRCYPEQALQFFTALKYLGKEAELVLCKGAHGIFVRGTPQTKIARLKHIVRWFDKHLRQDKQDSRQKKS